MQWAIAFIIIAQSQGAAYTFSGLQFLMAFRIAMQDLTVA